MKITNAALLFIMIILPFVVRNIITGEVLEQKIYNKIWLDKVVDTAVDDAIDDLLVRGISNTLEIDKEAALSSFLETLYLNMGALGNDTKEALIDLYVPAFVVMDYDGFYVCHLMTYQSVDGTDNTKHIWSDKIPYVWELAGNIYAFCMDNQVKIISSSDDEVYEGHWEVLRDGIENFPFQTEDDFQWRRQATITRLVEDHLRSAVSDHNKIAQRYGLTYDFSLPVFEDSTWNQCLEDIGILTFVQGIPMGFAGAYYNRYSLGGASIYKGEPYVVEVDPSGRMTYHKSECSHVTDEGIPVMTDYEAAKMGAMPCEDCKP